MRICLAQVQQCQEAYILKEASSKRNAKSKKHATSIPKIMKIEKTLDIFTKFQINQKQNKKCSVSKNIVFKFDNQLLKSRIAQKLRNDKNE